MEYKILSASGPGAVDQVQREVNEALEQGWKLLGNLVQVVEPVINRDDPENWFKDEWVIYMQAVMKE